MGLWQCMAQVVVRVEGDALNPEELRNQIDTEDCGSVVTFVGLTRGMEDGVEVEKLEFDAWGKRCSPPFSNDLD